MTSSDNTIYILGSGAIGLALGLFLHQHGRTVLLVRTSTADTSRTTIKATVNRRDDPDNPLTAELPIISLAQLAQLQGIIVVTAKAYANEQIAAELHQKAAAGPIILLQNGVGVEQPFLTAGFSDIYRCILYFSSQKTADHTVWVKAVNSSPIGVIRGSESTLASCVEQLHTAPFPFHADPNIQEAIWQKALINAAFNTICPLLETDNGVFARDPRAAVLAREMINEGVQVARAVGVELEADTLMAQLLRLSTLSAGQLISTLQDIQNGRPTEIDALNIAIARIAAEQTPPIAVPQTKLLGELIAIKAAPLT